MSGRQQLSEWIADRHYSVVAASEVLDIPEASMRAYLSGARRPGAQRAEKFRAKCRIPVAAWSQPAAEEEVPRG